MARQSDSRLRFFNFDKLVFIALFGATAYLYLCQTGCLSRYDLYRDARIFDYAFFALVIYLLGSICVINGGGRGRRGADDGGAPGAKTKGGPASLLAGVGYLLTFFMFAVLVGCVYSSFMSSDYHNRLPGGACLPASDFDRIHPQPGIKWVHPDVAAPAQSW